MKISVLSDCHLGSGHNTERENDAFDNFEWAIENSKDCDVIVIAGDLFDTRSPRTTVWARAIAGLNVPMLRRTGVSTVAVTRELNGVHTRSLEAQPVVALHGNHDRRMRNETNAVQALDKAGLLVHLERDTIVFEKDGVKVAVHGMSSVPERYAGGTLKEWDPKPIKDAFNMLVIHQNVDPYVYSPLEPPSIKLEDLPKGFDMILDGHIHSRVVDKANGTPFIILGSTVTTQFDRKEAGSNKGFHKMTFEAGKAPEIEFVPIECNRRFFYYEVPADNVEAMRVEIDARLNDIVNENLEKRPVVKFKVFGKDTKPIDQDLAALHRKYSEKTILSFVKHMESDEIAQKLETMASLPDRRMSIDEIGLSMLKSNVGQIGGTGFDAEEMFEMLSANETEKAFAILTGDQRTLYRMAVEK